MLDVIMPYVKPELIVVAIVLYLIGVAIKQSEKVKDKYIPFILGLVGIVLCAIYVISTTDLSGYQSVLSAIFVSIVQGILVAGLSNYVNQLIKQSKELS